MRTNKLIDLIKANDLRLIRIDCKKMGKAEFTDSYGQSWEVDADFPVDDFVMVKGYADLLSLQLDCRKYLLEKGV